MAKTEELKGVDCGVDALEGIRIVLRGRLAVMYDLRAAALDWQDSEGVHKMRVASRRLRSALRDFEEFMEIGTVTERGIKEVARALGDVRDQDVAIEALEKVRKKADGDVAEGIGQLISEREAVRVGARVKLQLAIAAAPLAELREKFLLRLDKVVGKKGGGRKRGNFIEAGRAVIASRLEELRDHSDSLHHPFDSKPLHEMRIAAKRLRYALEMFAACWGERLTSYSREVAKLQTALGDLHDCDTWIADLGARLDRHQEESGGAESIGIDSRVRPAAIWLLRHFTKKHAKHFRHALARWHEWETGGFLIQIPQLLAQDNGEESLTEDAPVAAQESGLVVP